MNLNLRYLYNGVLAGINDFELKGVPFRFEQNQKNLNPFNRDGLYMIFLSGQFGGDK